MKKREGEFARLPNGEKVRIVSRDGDKQSPPLLLCAGLRSVI